MRFLLDTHTFLWFVLNAPQISAKAIELISDPTHTILVSPATYWEIAIKISLGKYQLPEPLQPWMDRQLAINDFEILSIQIAHAAVVSTLPFHHRDPFDRLLCAQALSEAISIIGIDTAFDAYGVVRHW